MTTEVVLAETGGVRRFGSQRKATAYAGLAPGIRQSDKRTKQLPITKTGSRLLRTALVELAWRLVRFQPHYPPIKKRLGLLAKGARATGAARKKAIVAVARQLAVDLWRLQTGRCTPTALGLLN